MAMYIKGPNGEAVKVKVYDIPDYKEFQTTEAYTSRVTANGERVADGSKAKVLKVEGSTVKTTNLLDDSAVVGKSLGSDLTNAQILFTIRAGTYTVFIKLKKSTDVIINTFSLSLVDKNYKSVKSTLFSGGDLTKTNAPNVAHTFSLTEAEAAKVKYVSLYFNAETGASYVGDEVKFIMLNEGDTIKPYSPYFTGLKNASFKGIKSNNVDGTEEDTLELPEAIDCGLGTTIDFENQKIIETRDEYTFTGQERWNGKNGSYFTDVLFDLMKYSNGNGICDRFPLTFFGLATPVKGIGFGSPSVPYRIYMWIDGDKDIQEETKGMVVRYPMKLVKETPFINAQKAVGDKYAVWHKGNETIEQGETDNSVHGAIPTVTQGYIDGTLVKGEIRDGGESK